jgi:hypothetical protein
LSLASVQAGLRQAGSRNVSGDDWTCVGHDDRRASLAVREGDEPGKVILACGAGCSAETVMAAIGLPMSELFDDGPGKRLATEKYAYVDENGAPLFRVSRLQFERDKRFYQNAADGEGGWRRGKDNMKGVRLVLFRLPQVLKAARKRKVIHVVEGEKDVLRLKAEGVAATTKPGGAKKPWLVSYTESLRGAKEVVVWADRDRPGYHSAQATVSALLAARIPARAVLPLPDHPHADVTDHLDAGHGANDGKPVELDELAAMAAEPDSDDEAEDEILAAIRAEFLVDLASAHDHFDDLLSDAEVAALPPVEYAIDDWVPVGTYTVIYGEPGIGKTFALLGMSRAVRRGTRWQNNKTTKGGVLFYQGEGLRQFQDRIAAWDDRYPLRRDQSMAPVGYTERVVDLTQPRGVAAIIRTVYQFEKQHSTKVRLLVIDPLVEFMTGEENGEGMERASRGLRALAKLLDVGVVVGHHTNASGDRERGAAFLRMRAGAHIRMEPLDETSQIGLLQHKQRNGDKQALVLRMVGSSDSVVLELTEAMLAEDYVAKKESNRRKKQEQTRKMTLQSKRSQAEALLIAAIKAEPGIAKDALIRACKGHDVGTDYLEDARLALVTDGTRVRMETGARNAQKHYLATVDSQ